MIAVEGMWEFRDWSLILRERAQDNLEGVHMIIRMKWVRVETILESFLSLRLECMYPRVMILVAITITC